MPNVARLQARDPRILGDFRLIGRIGEGGQGVVYLGADRDTDEKVAVKLLHGTLGWDPGSRERFMREAELGMQVASFCTARIRSAGMADDRPYIVTEYIEGPCLQRRVTTEGVLTGGALERLAIGTATALTAIHQAGIVHRDLKPANVLLGPDGPRVIDFGIALSLDATLTGTNRVVGTPAYMAPERFSGERVNRAADVFSWGATIAFAATGRAPFGTDTFPAVLNRVLNEAPDLDGLTGPLRELVERCLDKDPERRPAAQDVLLGLLGDDEPAGSVTTPVLSAASELASAEETNPPVPRGLRRRVLSRAGAQRVLLPTAALVVIASTFLVAARPTGTGNLARADAAGGAAPEVAWPTTSAPAAPPTTAAPQIKVPNVTKLSKGSAEGRLRAAGLAVGTVTMDCSARNPGKVTRTSPAAGEMLAPHATVDIVMAAKKAVVLDGKGWPVDQARKVLEKNGFTVKITKQKSGYWHGRIFSQSPAAGARACPGTQVVLRIGTA